MRALDDMWTMTKRSLRHTTRSLDTIITVVLTPVAILLLFVYVFGGALGQQTGSIDYVDFITPGVIIMTVGSRIPYAAVRLSMDLHQGHHQSLPGHAGCAFVGLERSGPVVDALEPVLLLPRAGRRVRRRLSPGRRSRRLVVFAGLLVLFTLATTWMAMFFGLLASTVEGAGAFSYVLLLLSFIGPSFVPTASMTTAGTLGTDIGPALAWSAGILVVSYGLAVSTYRRRAPVPAAR